jgi:hypothetical protein
MDYNRQKRTRFALLANQIANFLKLKGALYLTVFGGLWIFAPYLHVFYLNSDVVGVFGFKWMTSFLFALALPLTLISGGFIVRYMANYMPSGGGNFKKLSNIVQCSGMFFLLWTFYPMTDDFKWYIYYPVLLVLSIAFAFFSKYVYVYAFNVEERLRLRVIKLTKALNEMIRFAVNQRFKAKDLREF